MRRIVLPTTGAEAQENRDAMAHRDMPALEDILAAGYTLTHMTGYVQPKADWLRDIDTDRMPTLTRQAMA